MPCVIDKNMLMGTFVIPFSANVYNVTNVTEHIARISGIYLFLIILIDFNNNPIHQQTGIRINNSG